MYRLVCKPGHPRADITGLVSNHVLIAEEALGRPLKKGELVHHKDFDKLNDDLANLLLPITRPEHQKLPEYLSRFILYKNLYEEFLVWWRQEVIRDKANAEERELERKLVKAENDRERLKARASRG